MVREMVNGFSGMITDKLKSKVNIIEVKNTGNGLFRIIMVNQRNKELLVSGKLIAYINIGLIMGI